MGEKIFCMGRPILDITATISSSRSLLGNIKMRRSDSEARDLLGILSQNAKNCFISIGGVEFNFGINCSLLGVPCILVGAVGDDEWSQKFRQRINRYSRDTGRLELFLTIVKNYPIGTILIAWINRESGQRERIKVVNYGASEYIEWNGQLLDKFQGCQSYFSSLFLANTPKMEATFREGIRLARQLQKKIIVSLAGITTISPERRGGILNIIRGCADIVFMNEVEARTCGVPPRSLFPNSELLVITREEKGALIFSREEEIAVGPASLVSSTPIFEVGAGDAFAAGFISALYQGVDIKTAGEVGSRIASLKIMHPESHLTGADIERLKGGGN